MNKDTGNVGAEVDILLENGNYSIAVEVKVKPDTKDVEKHITRLKFLRQFKDDKGDKREIRGALAGAIMPNKVKEMALQAGLYVIEQSGDTVKIEPPQQVRGWRWLE
jgi:RecB family endonuclease NucS